MRQKKIIKIVMVGPGGWSRLLRNVPVFERMVRKIEKLSPRAVVETLGLVDGAGFAPIGIGSLPEILRGGTEVHCQIQKMTLEAALSGNRKLAFEALMLDPLCAKLAPSQIHKMGLELMAATGEYLPQFK